MFKKEPSEVQPLIDFIKAHSEDFELTEYTIKHRKTDLEIWISNPPDSYGFYGPNFISERARSMFSKEAQKVFHRFISEFINERLELERKEKVATKIKLLINS